MHYNIVMQKIDIRQFRNQEYEELTCAKSLALEPRGVGGGSNSQWRWPSKCVGSTLSLPKQTD